MSESGRSMSSEEFKRYIQKKHAANNKKSHPKTVTFAYKRQLWEKPRKLSGFWLKTVKAKDENYEHILFSDWLDHYYPDALWWHTPNEGRRSYKAQWLLKEMGVLKGVSDFVIAEPNDQYKGLIIELKTAGTKVITKTGSPYKKVEHQYDFLMKMQKRGYKATFAIGYKEAIEVAKKYFKKWPRLEK